MINGLILMISSLWENVKSQGGIKYTTSLALMMFFDGLTSVLAMIMLHAVGRFITVR